MSIMEHAVEVLRMHQQYGLDVAFVATDDRGAAEELREAVGGVVRLVWIPEESFDRGRLVSGDLVWLENRLEGGELSGYALGIFTLQDMAILSRAAAFVGHFSSNLSRLSYLMAVKRQRHFPPFASVDGAWCFHWRMCCGPDPAWPHSTVC